MVGKDEVEKLFSLARISPLPHEVEQLTKDLEEVLSYVSALRTVPFEQSTDNSVFENVFFGQNMREDEEPHKEGVYTRPLLAQAKQVYENYLVVAQMFDDQV